MKRIGISVYPESSSYEENLNYIQKCADLGFNVLFTTLLKGRREDFEQYSKLLNAAAQLGFEVFCDISKEALFNLKIDINGIHEFKKLGISALRLDEGFSSDEISQLSRNKHAMQIILNMSTDIEILNKLKSAGANFTNLSGCHNFYPRRYTALELQDFIRLSENFKQFGMMTKAFVTSQSGTHGARGIAEGLVTLEMHRELEILSQAKFMFYSGLIDDVIIGNYYADDCELEHLSMMNKELITLKLNPVNTITEIECKIIEHPHKYRADTSHYIIRSSSPRITYKDSNIPSNNTCDIKRGDVTIDNDGYEQYKGELHIALKDMKNDGKVNVIGTIHEEEIAILDNMQPGCAFQFEYE